MRIPLGVRVKLWAIKRWLRTKEGRAMLKWLEGKKEIIVSILGAVALLLPVIGLAPDQIQALATIQRAIQAGDWGAALTATVGCILLFGRAAFRAYLNRQSEKK